MSNRSSASSPPPTPAPPKASASAKAMLSARDDGEPPPPPAAAFIAVDVVFVAVLHACLDAEDGVFGPATTGVDTAAGENEEEEEQEEEEEEGATVRALKPACQPTAGCTAAFVLWTERKRSGWDAGVVVYRVSKLSRG